MYTFHLMVIEMCNETQRTAMPNCVHSSLPSFVKTCKIDNNANFMKYSIAMFGLVVKVPGC
jgi:hypothetical protein